MSENVTVANSATIEVLGDDRTSVIVVWSLYLANLLIPFMGLIGLIVAYVKRGDAKSDEARSHYDKAIKTFWYALLGFVIGALLWVFVIGVPIVFAAAIWVLVVSVKGLIRAIDNRPYA